MPRRKLRAKRIIPELLKNNINVQIYLSQYKLTDIPNPSDDSDFEDTSYETDILHERETKKKLKQEAEKQLQIEKSREGNAKKYYQKHKNNPHSIFNLKGMNFEHYSHTFISFIFSPSAFSSKFICAHRKYHLTLKYEKSWWRLKRFHIPNKDEIVRLFLKCTVDDDNLIFTLFKIYDCLVQCTYDQINMRKEKYEKFLNHEEVELNSDDEKLFFSPEERKRRRANVMKIWKRMLPPNYTSTSDNESL